MTRIVPLFLVFALACEAPASDADCGADTAEPTATETELPDPIQAVLQPFTFDGQPVVDADICSEFGCWPLDGSMVSVEVRPESDVKVWVEGEGYGRAVYEFHSDNWNMDVWNLRVASDLDQESIAAAFGETIDEDTSVVGQYVRHALGVMPDLGGVGRGPYFADADFEALPDAAMVPSEGGYYLFFGVPPGSHVVDLGRCAEGGAHWGTPGDFRIPIELEAGDQLQLLHTNCE